MTHPPINPDAPLHEISFEEFEGRLIRGLGAAVGGSALSLALGYPTQESFRKAQQRGRIPVPTFTIAGRRGRFAAGTDIAQWLWQQRLNG